MTTPTLRLLAALSLLLSAALFGAPASAKRYNAESARSALDAKQGEVNHVVGEITRKVKYLRDRGLTCTSYPREVNAMFLTPMERKHNQYKAEVQQELTKLRSGVQSKPAAFASIDACEGYKTAAIQDFTGKKIVISNARKSLKQEVTRPAQADLHKLFRERQARLMNKTPYEALTAAFEKTESVPNCPPDAQRVYLSLANHRNDDADLSKFVTRMEQLDQLLDDYGDSLSSIVREIGKIKCDTAVAPLPPVKPEVKQEVRPEVKPEVRPEVKPEVQPEVKPEVRPEPAPVPTRTETETRTEPAPVRPESGEPPPITETDRWGKPRSWKEYDDYKNSIGAPNKVTGVNVNTFYDDFTRTNGIQIRNADDALRLQKAINETTIQVAGHDGIGPSVYQDGQVGSRTKSALYLMQNDPYYRDALMANLRRQGLVR